MVVIPNPDFQLVVGDVRTGRVHARLPFAALKWGQRLNAAGGMSATLRPHAKQLAHYDLRSLTATVKQFMAVDYRGTLLEGGPIWTRPYDQDTGELKLNGLGLWSIFDRRKNVPGAALLPGAKVTEVGIYPRNLHRGSIARELVRISIQDNPYGGDLPVVLPASIAGTEGRDYPGYGLSWLGDDLRTLTKEQNGPDLRFKPRYVSGDPTRVEWALEHGAIDILQQDGPDWEWDAKVERSAVAKLGVDQDGTGVAAMAWTPGSGQEQEMKMAAARDASLVSAGYPWTETEESANSIEDEAVLQSLASRKLADSMRPWDTWSMTVRADRTPRLGSYLPGDWARVNVPDDHPILPPGGKVRVRILSVDGDHTADVKLSVAPIQGSV